MLKIPILRCLFLIGGGYQLNDQYGPATGMARAFRNGITLDDRPNNEGVRAYFVKFGIFGKKCLKTKSPWKGPPWTFLGKLNGTRWYVWMVLRDFCQKIKTSWRRWPRYCSIAHCEWLTPFWVSRYQAESMGSPVMHFMRLKLSHHQTANRITKYLLLRRCKDTNM